MRMSPALGIGSAALFPRISTFSMMPQQGFWGTNDWITTLTVRSPATWSRLPR